MARWSGLGTALLLAGCAHHHPGKPEAPLPTAPPAALPQPPAGSAAGQTVPEPGSDGRFETINSHVGAEEALWHVRAALNVAALSCSGRPGGAAIVARYNALLTQRKAVFATAYASETARAGALDQHMTRLYNFFAQPPAQAAFCRAAAEVSEQAAAVPANGLPQFAPGALDRLEAPILDYYRAYARYRSELAAWQAGRRATPPPTQLAAKVVTPRETAVAAAHADTGASWRIQLGAFTGKPAAEAAWTRARGRLPALAAYQPHYEDVPHSPLVRLQVGAADDKAGALRLCATAAAGGFDCLPVPRS
jgi:hypothetical protein